MKHRFIIALAVLFTLQAAAQHQFYLGAAIDPKMAYQGPGGNYTETSSLNFELRLGVETETFRVGINHELHETIGYKKTVLILEYKLSDFIFENLDAYAGVEAGVIFRKDSDRWKGKSHFLNPGVNFELQYPIFQNLYAAVNCNIFRAESTLIETGKQIRWDAMAGLYLKI